MDIEKLAGDDSSGVARVVAEAAQLLTSGKLNDARAVLHSAMQRWPGSLELQLGFAEVAIKEGKPVEGEAILRSLRKQFPNHWQPALALASLHLRGKQGRRARWALAQAVALGAPNQAVLRLQASLAHLRGNAEEFEASLKSVAHINNADDQAVTGVLNLLISQGRLDDAVRFAEETLARHPTNERLYFFLLRSARNIQDAARILEICERHDQAFPANPIWVVNRIDALMQLSRSDDAKRHALRHRPLWKSDRLMIATVSGLSWSADERLPVAAQLADIGRSAGASMAVISACIVGLLAMGADDSAQEILNAVPADRRGSVGLVRSLIARAPKEVEIPAFDQPTTVIPRPGSSKCLLVFTGMADSMQIPTQLLHRLVAPLNVHAIYFRDDLRNFYLQGISGLGTGLAQSLQGVRGILESLGQPEVYAYGNRTGGFAAIRYGIELGARAVMLTSAATKLTEEFAGDNTRVMGALRRLKGALDTSELDLRPALMAANPRPKVVLYHNAQNPAETKQVRHLAGVDGVELRAVAGTRAGTMLPMIEHDLLVPGLREMMDLDRH